MEPSNQNQQVERRWVPGSGAKRNMPCPCGSGKKFKKCCLPITEGLKKDEHGNWVCAHPFPLKATLPNGIVVEICQSCRTVISQSEQEGVSVVDTQKQSPQSIVEARPEVDTLRGNNSVIQEGSGGGDLPQGKNKKLAVPMVVS